MKNPFFTLTDPDEDYKNVEFSDKECDMEEVEWQEIIEKYYSRQGFETTNLHKSGASQEKGADIVAYKDKENSIALQVKMSPKSMDRSQLIDLDERDEKTKIYYYFQDPVERFYKEMTKYSGKIAFKNSKEFAKEMFHNDPWLFYWVYYLSNEARFNGNEIVSKLKNMRDRWTNIKLIRQEEDVGDILYKLKDYASVLHKFGEINCDVFSSLEQMQTNDSGAEYVAFQAIARTLYSTSHLCDVISRCIETIEMKKPSLIKKVMQQTYMRSHLTTSLPMAANDFFPKKITENYLGKIDNEFIPNDKGCKAISFMACIFSGISQLGYVIEEVVDDMSIEELGINMI